jgi:hypothetical protein
MTGKSKQAAVAANQQAGDGGQGVNSPVVPCKAQPDPLLLVKVCCNSGGRKAIHATVSANAQTRTSVAKSGLADFGTVAVDTYTVKVDSFLAPDDKDYFAPATLPVTAALAKGDRRTIELVVEKKNVVSPKLELEYKVVLLDRKLSQHQDASEPKKFFADVTYVEVSIAETNKAYPYAGGARITGANVDIYLEEKCEDVDKLVGDLTPAQLPVDRKVKLYLKGKTLGRFTLKLELIDPADERIRINDPVEEKMGVVELKMKLHQPDMPKITALRVHPDVASAETYHQELKDLELPDQIELPDADRVRTGRVLHVKNGKSSARARLLIEKYTADHWPEGTDAYELVLNTTDTSGGIEIHEKDWKDSLKKDVKIKVSDLKKKDHEFWVQGKAVTSKAADVLLDLGLHRGSGGLAHTIKRHGDWARFTVVQIQDVKVDYTTPANSAAAWNAADKRFYINLQADPAGRTVTIKATLSSKIKDVVVHFMLAPDKKNLKKANWGVDLPSTWTWSTIDPALKHRDKTARSQGAAADYLHLSAKTDAEGSAQVDLTLSRFCGDVFHPAAYVEQDAHLAKYVRGNSKLEEKKPTLAADPIKVWRKVWYQITKPNGLAVPNPDAMIAAYKAIQTEVVLDQTVEFDAGSSPARTFYPERMFVLNSASNTQVANIGSENKVNLSGKLVTKADQPVKRHLMVCLYQCDVKPTKSGQSGGITSDKAGEWVGINIDNTLYVLDPPLEGGEIATSIYWYRRSAPAIHHAIAATSANIRVPNPRKTRGHVEVLVPAIAPAPTAADPVHLVAECKTAKHFLGESFLTRHTLAVFDKDDVPDFNDTVTHEFGHSFNQTPRPGTQPGPGIPDHPTQADRGQGNHCQVNKGQSGGNTKFICVMYDSGPMKWGIHKFCTTCGPYLLVEDFHKP